MSSLLSRMVAFWRNGVSFGGARDFYATFGWNRNPTFQDFLAMYRRQDISKRVVNAPAAALWADPPVVVGDVAFQKAWNNLLQTIPVFFNLQRIDKLCGIGRYSVLLIGLDDGRDLSLPVNSNQTRKVLYLQPYSECSAEITQWDTNPSSPRFGMPLQYTINPGKEQVNLGVAQAFKTGKAFNVHYTRVVHVAENALETLVYGRARLESVYNALCDMQKIAGGAAETFWLAGNRGLHVNVDKDMELDEEDENALSEELKEYQHEIRRIIRTRGVEVNPVGSDVADPRGVFDTLLSLISADTGIPKRILAGSEAGQLASQQDRASWAQRIEERIAEFGEPIVLIPFIRTLIDANVLPEPTTFEIDWPDAFKMNPLERAQTSAQMARSAANLSKTLQTIENLNQSMARAALPQLVNAPMSGTSSSKSVPTSQSPKAQRALRGPTDQSFSSPLADNASQSDNKPAPTGGGDSGNSPFGPPSTQVIEADPLMPARTPINLLTPEECRQIIGFGKHPPVFDATLNEHISAVRKPGRG